MTRALPYRRMRRTAQDWLRPAPRQGRTAVYWFFDANGRLLYVGITNNIEARWAQHAADKPWWREVAVKKVKWYPTRAAAERAEYLAIRAGLPLYNVEHNEDNPHRVRYRINDVPRRRPGRSHPRLVRVFGRRGHPIVWPALLAGLSAASYGLPDARWSFGAGVTFGLAAYLVARRRWRWLR